MSDIEIEFQDIKRELDKFADLAKIDLSNIPEYNKLLNRVDDFQDSYIAQDIDISEYIKALEQNKGYQNIQLMKLVKVSTNVENYKS
jgi:uncharacterized protein with von Willebrand factor type A (vWA) domain